MNLVRLGDLTRIKTGKLDANASSPNGKYPFFTCSREPLRIETYSYDCECVLVAGNGDLNVKYYNGRFDAYQRTYIIESNNTNVLLPRYLFFFLELYIEILRKQSVGGVIKYIKLGNLTEAQIPLCSIQEQTEIIALLEKQCNLIESRKNQLVLFDDLVKSQFIEMFGDPETNPYDFEKVAINDVCSSIVRGPFGSALKKDFFIEKSNNSYKVYEQKHAIQKSATIGTYYIDELKFKELSRFECKPGDFIMSCSGTMGELYQLPKDCERGIINQALCKFTLNDKISPVFFTTYMSQTIGNLETKGSGIKNIAAVSYVKSMPVILPPLEIQNQFARFVEQTDKSKVLMEKSQKIVQMLIKLIFQLTKIDIEYCNDRKIYSDML